jgi:hypothetical protein
MVLLSSSCRETAKKRDKKNRRGKTTGNKFFPPQFFWQKVFDMDFPQKFLCAVLTPLVKKRTKTPFKKKRKKKKQGTYLPHLAAIWQTHAAFRISAIVFFGLRRLLKTSAVTGSHWEMENSCVC